MENDEQKIEKVRKIRIGRPKKTGHKPKNRYRSFRLAREFARRQKLATREAWFRFTKTEKMPEDIPIDPKVSYPTRFVDWYDWLGTTKEESSKFQPVYTLTMVECMELVAPYKFQSSAEYVEAVSKPEHPLHGKVPLRPMIRYKDEWEGWAYYCGYPGERMPRQQSLESRQAVAEKKRGKHYRPYMEAVKFVSSFGLRDYHEWIKWRSVYPHDDIPWRPHETYKEWTNWPIWLGHDPLPGLLADVGVLYMSVEPNEPSNVYRIALHEMGKSDLIQKARVSGMRILKIWKYDAKLSEEVREAIEKNARSYYGSDEVYIVPNVHGLFNDMFNVLQVLV